MLGQWTSEQWARGQCHNVYWNNGTIGPWDSRLWDIGPMRNKTMDIGTMATGAMRSGTVDNGTVGLFLCAYATDINVDSSI